MERILNSLVVGDVVDSLRLRMSFRVCSHLAKVAWMVDSLHLMRRAENSSMRDGDWWRRNDNVLPVLFI